MSGVVLFGCSFYFRSRKGAAAFTSAEGTLPTWVVGMSIFATFVSSISFLGLPGDAYKGIGIRLCLVFRYQLLHGLLQGIYPSVQRDK